MGPPPLVPVPVAAKTTTDEPFVCGRGSVAEGVPMNRVDVNPIGAWVLEPGADDGAMSLTPA